MTVLLGWLTTIALSVGMEISLVLRVYKDLADRGYRLKHDKLSDYTEKNNPDYIKKNKSSLIIPIYNLFMQLSKAMDYTTMIKRVQF